jgi:predicted nucleotidyltransferase
MIAARPPIAGPVFLTQDALREIARQIAARFAPEKVILFGSLVWGTPRPHSDVDLLVVLRTEEHPADLEARIAMSCRPPFVPMDILVRTPEEVTERLRLGDSFLRRILEKGQVLYERPADPGVDRQG